MLDTIEVGDAVRVFRGVYEGCGFFVKDIRERAYLWRQGAIEVWIDSEDIILVKKIFRC